MARIGASAEWKRVAPNGNVITDTYAPIVRMNLVSIVDTKYNKLQRLTGQNS